MTTNGDPYESLVGKLGFLGSGLLSTILEALMTPQQAQMADCLPGTVADIAKKTDCTKDEVRRALDDLFRKGVVFPKGDFENREYYRFARHIMQLHDAVQASANLDVVKDRGFFQLWHDFCVEEMYPRYGALFKGMQTRLTRVVPAHNAIKDLPDVLPCEDYHEILRSQELIAVVPCSCRLRAAAVGEKCEHTHEVETWHCLQFGRGAEYAINRGSGRKLTLSEAIALCDQIEDDGLIHRWANKADMTGVNTSCNCCRDCCEEFVSLDMAGIPTADWWEKSRYIAYVDDVESCNGCGDCVERCQFDAIAVTEDALGEFKAGIDAEKCFGCGACVVGCPYESLKMRAVRSPEFIHGAVPFEQDAHIFQ